MMRIRGLLTAGLVAALWCGGALARDLVSAADPEAVLTAAKGFGSAELQTDSVGDPRIRGRMFGVIYLVTFYGCDDGKDCKDILFYAGWEQPGLTLEDVNRWNRDKRFGKAYIDDEGDAVLEFAVNLNYGVTPRNLEDTFDWWGVVLREFREEML
ncbi:MULTISPECIES: YbjN domain-containing protein [Marichromatium]|nr:MULTISPECIES: YbjN domain-containing protein [Marichromatium]MBO8085126.1 YbjN domain-containing protein [Marichromatium sp.]RNE88764.1 YbjN domain-containing protein [Marichromatium sp. AB31]MBK1707855.1 YbjN domain-containing protein [Marichromatium gracile]RNE89149.1 YbjN domain-containing protein [Marichromatium sp. AB32]TCW38371.1 putative sensory transduction regulator [Marichromatium gracile]